MELLVDSDAFWACLQDDIAGARERVYVQTLSLEGDSAGLGLSTALLARTVPVRRILCDSFTKYMQNDRFLYSPVNLIDTELRRELRETNQMIRRLRSGGVEVKFTNPVGPFLVRFLARNHKKMVIIDSRVAYVGGINFSEHNFSWHDMMLRIEDEEVAGFLVEDYLATWAGHNKYASGKFDGLELRLLDGRMNHLAFQDVFGHIDTTRRSIFVESPYLTFPLYERLRAARERGVEVSVITPEVNNWQIMSDYVAWESQRSDSVLHLYVPRMTHLKAMLLDDEVLIVGSSNFDFLSYRLHQEILAFVTAKDVIADFRVRVMEVDLARSRASVPRVGGVRGRFRKFQLKAIDGLASLLGRL